MLTHSPIHPSIYTTQHTHTHSFCIIIITIQNRATTRTPLPSVLKRRQCKGRPFPLANGPRYLPSSGDMMIMMVMAHYIPLKNASFTLGSLSFYFLFVLFTLFPGPICEKHCTWHERHFQWRYVHCHRLCFLRF